MHDLSRRVHRGGAGRAHQGGDCRARAEGRDRRAVVVSDPLRARHDRERDQPAGWKRPRRRRTDAGALYRTSAGVLAARTRMLEDAAIDPALLIRAYREGIFPMALEDGEIGWFSPDPRGIIPL